MRRKLHIAAIAFILLFFFSVPLMFVAYGAAGLLGGIVILAPLMALQFLVLRWLERRPPSQDANSGPDR